MNKFSEILSGSGQMNEIEQTHSLSCGDRYQNHQKRDTYAKTVFKCPSKCEGDKTYDVTGKCPVCNTPLEKGDKMHQHYYL